MKSSAMSSLELGGMKQERMNKEKVAPSHLSERDSLKDSEDSRRDHVGFEVS